MTFDNLSWSREAGQMMYGMPTPLTIAAEVTTTPDSPPVEGSGLWKMDLFGSRSMNGSGVRLNERTQILDSYNQAKSLAGGGTPLEFSDVRSNFPLEDLGCGEYKYLCLEFTKGDYANPDYTYATTSGKQSVINCLPEKCRGKNCLFICICLCVCMRLYLHSLVVHNCWKVCFWKVEVVWENV